MSRELCSRVFLSLILLLLLLTVANTHLSSSAVAQTEKPPAPNGVQSLATYEDRIGEPGLLIEDPNLQIWVPERYEEHSRLIFEYLQSGYEVLQEMFGGHDMPVKFSVEHYPPDSPYGWGGTDARGTIRYGYSNLEDDSPEWHQYGVPHVAGYYEEMAHCFAYDLGLRGEVSVGYYETLGMMIGGETALRAAWNPYTQQGIDDSYQVFAATTEYYLEHNTGEPDVPENIYLTRILAHIFKTEVVDVYGWEALSNAFAVIQSSYPLRAYARDHTWGGFLEYLGNVTESDLHAVFGNYGLPVMQWTGEPGYESDGIELTWEANRFRFRIKIFDREESQPIDVQLHLYKDSVASGTPLAMSFAGGNAQAGWIYEAEVEISEPGRYRYAFSANDGVHDVFQAVGEPTVKRFVLEHRLFLPLVVNNDPALPQLWQIGTFDDTWWEFDTDPHDDPTTVVFAIGQPDAEFPSGIGTDIGPQRSVIEIQFSGDLSAGSTLRIRWTPGGSPAVEQFSIVLNGNLIGQSEALAGEPNPYAFVTESFELPPTAGSDHILTLKHLMGDGNYWDALRLGGESP